MFVYMPRPPARTPLYKRLGTTATAPDPLLPMSRIAEITGLSYGALRSAVKRGELVAWRRRRGWHYVRKSEIERFLQAGIVTPREGRTGDAA